MFAISYWANKCVKTYEFAVFFNNFISKFNNMYFISGFPGDFQSFEIHEVDTRWCTAVDGTAQLVFRMFCIHHFASECGKQ